ncbi:MAG: HAD family phosphatase [Ruminococcus sp.]|nr:HAD family phosphatase [Ruminococcus sp.]
MIQGAIFDLDGTLLDSMYIWDGIGEAYLRSIGFEPKENLCETFRSMSLYQAACYCRSEYGVPLSVQEIMDGVNKMVERYYSDEVQLKFGIKELLKELYHRGVKMCIATATERNQVEAALKRCGVLHYFTEIFTCTSVGYGKDNPSIYREALKHLGTEKTKTVVFEDAEYALITAKADGFVTVGVYDEHEKNQDSVKNLADFYMSNYCEINDFLEYAKSF